MIRTIGTKYRENGFLRSFIPRRFDQHFLVSFIFLFILSITYYSAKYTYLLYPPFNAFRAWFKVNDRSSITWRRSSVSKIPTIGRIFDVRSVSNWATMFRAQFTGSQWWQRIATSRRKWNDKSGPPRSSLVIALSAAINTIKLTVTISNVGRSAVAVLATV